MVCKWCVNGVGRVWEGHWKGVEMVEKWCENGEEMVWKWYRNGV